MKITASVAGLTISTLSPSIGIPLVFLLSCSVVDAGSPYPSSTQIHSFDATRRCSKIIRKNTSGIFNGGINYEGNSLNRLKQPERKKSSQIEILHRLRGGDTPPCKVGLLIEILDICGTAVFAFSGALKAGRKGMDIIGMMIIASITSMGGGTLRDVLMVGSHEEHVVFWMKTPLYLEISLLTALLTFYSWPVIEKRFGLDADSAAPICTADALGLAAFCIVGVESAAKKNLAPTLWIVSGLMTATFGGIIRDVICGEKPRVMYPHRTLYALGPTLGALTYTILNHLLKTQSWPLNSSSITLVSFLVAFLVRIASFNKPWRMPHWDVKQGKH